MAGVICGWGRLVRRGPTPGRVVREVLLINEKLAVANPYEPSEAPARERPAANVPQANTRGLWYVLLVPSALLYTFAAREIAGPGYTTAPNQGAMVVFFLAAVAWPVLALIFAATIRAIGRIRGVAATCFCLLAWAASSVVPFLIGPK